MAEMAEMSELQVDGHFQISGFISLEMRAVDVAGSSETKVLTTTAFQRALLSLVANSSGPSLVDRVVDQSPEIAAHIGRLSRRHG